MNVLSVWRAHVWRVCAHAPFDISFSMLFSMQSTPHLTAFEVLHGATRRAECDRLPESRLDEPHINKLRSVFYYQSP